MIIHPDAMMHCARTLFALLPEVVVTMRIHKNVSIPHGAMHGHVFHPNMATIVLEESPYGGLQ